MSIDHEQPNENASYSLWPIYVAIFLLMFVTFSPPQELAGGISGTQSILAPEKLTQLKLASRLISAILILGSLFVVSYRKNIVGDFTRFFPLILFGCWAFFSINWSVIPRTTLVQSGSFGVLILLSLTICTLWNSEKDTSKILKMTSITFVLISMMLLVVRFGAPQYGALTRSSEGIFHTTYASSSASLGLLICFFGKIIWNWNWAHRLIWLAVPLHTAVIVLSGNRLTLALTSICICIGVLLFCRKDRVAISIFAVGLLGTGYLLFDPGASVVEKGMNKFGMFVSQGQTQSQLKSLSGRTEMWKEIWRSHKESPWKGHGYFVSSKTGQLYVWYQWGNWTAHNMWLQLLVTTGFIGLAIFLLHLGVIALSTGRMANSRDEPARKYLGFFVLMSFWYFGWGMLNSSIFGPTSPEAVFFFVFTGIALGQGAGIQSRIDSNRDDSPSATRRGL